MTRLDEDVKTLTELYNDSHRIISPSIEVVFYIGQSVSEKQQRNKNWKKNLIKTLNIVSNRFNDKFDVSFDYQFFPWAEEPLWEDYCSTLWREFEEKRLTSETTEKEMSYFDKQLKIKSEIISLVYEDALSKKVKDLISYHGKKGGETDEKKIIMAVTSEKGRKEGLAEVRNIYGTTGGNGQYVVVTHDKSVRRLSKRIQHELSHPLGAKDSINKKFSIMDYKWLKWTNRWDKENEERIKEGIPKFLEK